MRPRVEYKGWKIWGEGYEIEHLCSFKKTTTPWLFDGLADIITCTYCGAYMPKDTLLYFRRLNKLMNMVEDEKR